MRIDGSSHPRGEALFRVLVAEDDDANREIAARLLSRFGVEVAEVSDGEAALGTLLGAAGAGVFDVCVAFIDLSMPVMGGLEVARRARAAGCPVGLVALSGADSPDEALEAGFDVFCQKPFTGAELRVALDAGLAAWRRRIAAS